MSKNNIIVRIFIMEKRSRGDILKTILIATVVFAIGIANTLTPVYAKPVCIEITAEVNLVVDDYGFLDGAINVGDIITGTYDYESTTYDSNPSQTVGLYRHSSSPFGITLNAGGFVFRTDPNNVDFLLQILNDFDDPPRDIYSLISYNNIFDLSVPSVEINRISWQIIDFTYAALSNDALKTKPPYLDDWQTLNSLIIISISTTGEQFYIQAYVTSANICGDDPVQEYAICHKPNTVVQKTLFIPEQTLAGHLRHGDALGECQ